MIASATRRFRNRKGSCYLTHGADSYDKRGKRKTQRQLDRALIDEAINDHEPEPESQELIEWEMDEEWDMDEIIEDNRTFLDEAYQELTLVQTMIMLLTGYEEMIKNDISIAEKEIRKASFS